jgi:hypothetical protein
VRSDEVLSNEFVVRWDTQQQCLLISYLGSTSSAESLIRVRGSTLDKMQWPEASRFIGEFFTLLVPDLRKKYQSAIERSGKTDVDRDA